MVKKLKADALMIKELLKKGYKQCQISLLLGIKKEKVSYWARHELRTSQEKSKKLKDIYIQAIIRWATNKTTSSMSSRKIASKINSILRKRNEVDKRGKPITVHYTTVNNYLKKYFGKPRRIRKVFFMSNENRKKRVEFCRRILGMNIKPEQIFFTDESRIELSSFSNDWIRLDPKTKWSENTYKLLNRQEKKFPSSLTIAAGINYYGLSKLIFLDGTMNEFAYGQALLFYKDDIEEIEKREKINLIFEQDGASSHTSRTNKYLLNTFFKEDGWFQNPPNSPDLAYPIENLWAIIKPRVKRREPKSIEELKRILNEEWSSIPIEMVQNLCKGYLEKVKKILDLNGGRIEPEFREKKKQNIEYIWEKPEEIQKQRIVYNDKNLKFHKYREIKLMKREIKEIKKKFSEKMAIRKKKKTKIFKKRDLRGKPIGTALSIIQSQEKEKEEKKKSKEEKINLINEIEERIAKISKMNVFEYLKHINGETDDDNEKNSISTKDDVEEKVDNLENLIKEDKNVKYKKIKLTLKKEE